MALDRDLGKTEERLAAISGAAGADARAAASELARDIGDDALILLIDRTGVESYPEGRLPYYPTLPQQRAPQESLYAAGEAIELQRNDPAGASLVFRELAHSPDPGVRAGALLRLARSLRKTGRNKEALAA